MTSFKALHHDLDTALRDLRRAAQAFVRQRPEATLVCPSVSIRITSDAEKGVDALDGLDVPTRASLSAHHTIAWTQARTTLERAYAQAQGCTQKMGDAIHDLPVFANVHTRPILQISTKLYGWASPARFRMMHTVAHHTLRSPSYVVRKSPTFLAQSCPYNPDTFRRIVRALAAIGADEAFLVGSEPSGCTLPLWTVAHAENAPVSRQVHARDATSALALVAGAIYPSLAITGTPVSIQRVYDDPMDVHARLFGQPRRP